LCRDSNFVSKFKSHMLGKCCWKKDSCSPTSSLPFSERLGPAESVGRFFNVQFRNLNWRGLQPQILSRERETLFATQDLVLRTSAYLAPGELGAHCAPFTNGDRSTQQNKFSQRSPQKVMKNVQVFRAKDYESKPSGLGALTKIKSRSTRRWTFFY